MRCLAATAVLSLCLTCEPLFQSCQSSRYMQQRCTLLDLTVCFSFVNDRPVTVAEFTTATAVFTQVLLCLSCWRTTGNGKASVKYMSMSPAQLETYTTLPGVQNIPDTHSTLMWMRRATPTGQLRSALPGVLLLMLCSRPTVFLLPTSCFVVCLPLQYVHNLLPGHLLS